VTSSWSFILQQFHNVYIEKLMQKKLPALNKPNPLQSPPKKKISCVTSIHSQTHLNHLTLFPKQVSVPLFIRCYVHSDKSWHCAYSEFIREEELQLDLTLTSTLDEVE